MTVKEITDSIESFAPLHLQSSYDNSGLICGDPAREVSSALLCIDVTEEVVQEAIRQGDNLIISHHPLIFSGLKHLTTATYVERSVILAIRHDISIYAAHTNLDAVSGGVSGRMADKLGLIRRSVLRPEGGNTPETGYGIVGDLPEPADTMEFLNRVKETFHCPALRYTAPHTGQVRRVALCGGSGAAFLPEAIAGRADIYITGDVKYHDFFHTENRIILADIGHYESEQFTKEIFYELLTKKSTKFALRFSTINTNPINYI